MTTEIKTVQEDSFCNGIAITILNAITELNDYCISEGILVFPSVWYEIIVKRMSSMM